MAFCEGGLASSCTPFRASQAVLVVKNLPANAEDVRDVGSVPGLERSPGEEDNYPLQYSGLENSWRV